MRIIKPTLALFLGAAPRSVARLLCVLLGMLLALPHGARAAHLYGFSHVGVELGISSRRVNHIMVDRRGFVWACTPLGLDRFDGYAVKSFKYKVTDKGSVSIRDVQEYGPDTLLVNTGEGYCLFERSMERFLPADDFMARFGIDSRAKGVWIDDIQNVWVNSPKGFYVTTRDGRRHTVPTSGHDSEIRNICIVHGGVVALFASGRIVKCIAPSDGSAPAPVSMSSPIKGGSKALYFDSNSDIWAVSQQGDSLWFRSQAGKKWELKVSPQDLGERDSVRINGVAEDGQGGIWLSTERHGLYVIERKMGGFAHVRRNVALANGLRSDYCSCISASRRKESDNDASQAIYVGYMDAGFSVYDPRALKFESLASQSSDAQVRMVDVASIVPAWDSLVYVSTYGNGLWLVNCFTHETERIPLGPNAMVRGLAVGGRGKVYWSWEGRGLCSIDEDGHKVLSNEPNAPECIKERKVGCVAVSADGSLWVASGNKVQCRVGSTGKWCEQDYALESNVRVIRKCGRNEVLVVTEREIYNFRTERGKMFCETQMLEDDDAHPYDVCVDSRNLLWVASETDLRVYGRLNESWNEVWRHSQPGESFVAVIPDNRGGVIAASATHVAVITVTTLRNGSFGFDAAVYSSRAGLMRGAINPNALCQVPGGDIWVGGEMGISVYRPDDVVRELMLHRVYFSNLSVEGKDVEPNQKVYGVVPIDKSLLYEDCITLRENTPMVSLYVSLPGAASPKALTYTCKIDGLSVQEIVTTSPQIALPQLPRGSYTVRVVARNPDGANSFEGSIDIEVVGPWYSSTIFLSAVLLSLVIVIFVMLRLSKARLTFERFAPSNTWNNNVKVEDDTDDDTVRREVVVDVAANVQSSINGVVEKLKPLLEHRGWRNEDFFEAKLLSAKLEENGALLGMLTADKDVTVNRQYLILQRHDFVNLVRTYCTAIDSMTNGLVQLSFASSADCIIACYDEAMARMVLSDILTSAVAATSGRGFVDVWVGLKREFQGKAVMMVTVGGVDVTGDVGYFGSDKTLKNIPANVSNAIQQHNADLFRMERNDGSSTLLLIIPLG